MALNWNWSDKMGKMTITQTRRKKEQDGSFTEIKNKFNINIYACNALAAFIYEYKDENDNDMYSLYTFLSDKAHAERIVKEYGKLFDDDVTDIELNLKFPDAKKLFSIFVKHGYKVTCYNE